MSTFITETKGLPPALVKEFANLMRLLDKGPMGENGACAAFESSPFSLEFKTSVTPLADGKVKEVTSLINKGNITSIEGILNGIQGAAKGDKKDGANAEGAAVKAEGAEGAAVKAEGAEGAEVKAEGAEGKEGAAVKAEGAEGKEGAAVKAEGAEGAAVNAEGAEGAEGGAVKAEGAESAATSNMNKRALSKDDIKEIDAIDSKGARWKAYLIRKFAFPDLQDMNMVHFMGWATWADEFIPAAEEPKRILPRDENSKTGQNQRFDKTMDDVMKLYKDVDMEKMEMKAKEKAAELKEDATPVKSSASAASATAAAAAAATAAAATAAATAAPPPALVPTAAG